ncbi:hypothetical protein LCGC14_0350210 [marine sediment metagenome]|uniref:HNH domain-containing protein n=1 Tax=marine sediment metagenome TaxID=412755 RepID=A0A0F9TGV3_9ZZZZ
MKIKIDPLDKLVAKYIKLRDKWCQRCSGTSGLQTAHFHSRRKRSVRYDEDNLCLLCFGCHSYLDGNPLEKVEFFKQRLGDRFDFLVARANRPAKPDKSAIALYLKERIKEME